ncbi:MAG: pantoate--beta-alanine ligase [Thermodesulfobacteriota bacterium]|nr:pantoate--beta-alanine ligase [Thermodesulfobacteriota bacterium]
MAVRLYSNVSELREIVNQQRGRNRTIGFVPTMGFLHKGHQSLIKASRDHGNFTVVSVFVNPTQFGPNEDFKTYPRDSERDFELCKAAGGDFVWFPEVNDVYPKGSDTTVIPGALAGCLCGASRPRFLSGVLTVVLKLFNIIRPDRAYFGEKDFQQLVVIRRMTADFFMDIDVKGCPTVREPDGLAMSSRNVRLKSEKERDLALTLYRIILKAREAFGNGGRDAAALKESLMSLWPFDITLDYLDFRNPISLEEESVLALDTRIFLGAWLNGIRLIDNSPLVE